MGTYFTATASLRLGLWGAFHNVFKGVRETIAAASTFRRHGNDSWAHNSKQKARASKTKHKGGGGFCTGTISRWQTSGGGGISPPLGIPKLQLPHAQANAKFKVMNSWKSNGRTTTRIWIHHKYFASGNVSRPHTSGSSSQLHTHGAEIVSPFPPQTLHPHFVTVHSTQANKIAPTCLVSTSKKSDRRPPPPEQSRAASSGHLDRMHFSEGRYFWNACHVANSGSPLSGKLQCNINTQSGTVPWPALALEMQLLCSQYSTVDYELQPHAQ